MKLIKELRREGYDIRGAMFMDNDKHATVLSVSGHGLQTHVARDDMETWVSIFSIARDRRKRRNEIAKLISIMKAVAEERDIAAS